MDKLTSRLAKSQAELLLRRIEQVDSRHTKVAIISDHLDTLMVVAGMCGYNKVNMVFTGVTDKLHKEGVLED